jgi:poly(A) polymerase
VTVIAEHTGIEVTTLRRDVETFGRHATVAFTDDWREDAARRDLTMNALSADANGKVYDYFDGIADLQAGKVRFVGAPEDRMREDYLRILRYFRFHADYAAGDFDRPALQAAQALKGELKTLSGERLRQETLKLLVARRGVETWRTMLGEGIVDAFLPQATTIDRMAKVAELESRLKVPQDPIRRLAALTVTAAGPAVAETLKLSNAERDRLVALTMPGAEFATRDARAIRRQIYSLGNAMALDLLLVDWSVPDGPRAFEIVRDWPRPQFPLKGRDVSALGVPAGPEIGRQLKEMEDWWIAGDFAADREQALAELKRRIGGKT